MTYDIIDYGKLVDEAMHIIVYKVLKMVQDQGLPGNHHFFISFITKHPQVRISSNLTNKYPREMTIVLQYQFQDLIIDDNGFEVSLSFNGSKEKIYIPFNSITTFADPSVQFGLQFREVDFTYQEKANISPDKVFFDEDKSVNNTSAKISKKNKKSEVTNIISLDKFRKNKL